VLGAGFLFHAVRVWRDPQTAQGVSLTNDAPARAAFRFSLAYLAILFLAVALDHFVG
jgi:protoheme IX farnesyltransferase